MNTESSINFVKKDRSILKLQVRRMYIIQSASMFVLGAYVLVLILVFSYSTLLSYQNRVTERSIKQEITEIEKLTPIEAKYLILKQKVEAAVSTSKSMYRYQDLMRALFELIPSDLLIDGFSVDENNNIVFNAVTKNAQTIDDFISKVKQYNANQTDNELTQASIKSISIDRDGTYTLNILLYVKFNEES